MKIIGIDLAGKESRPTGLCVLIDNHTWTKTVHTDEEIIIIIDAERPDLIAIDAPFSLPKTGWWRQGDKELRKAGFRPLSPKFPAMRILVKRAQKLVKKLAGYEIIEVFPRATEKVLEAEKEPQADPHQYDALLCALTGKYYLAGKYRAFGPERIIEPVSD